MCSSYTDHGACRALARERSDIHAPSPQSYVRSHRTEAWRGGASAKAANGSALSMPVRVTREWTWYLYRAPWRTPGTKPSQIPDCSRGCSWLVALSHELKSPITLTESAFGAQTAKVAPSGSAERCAPSFSYRWPCVPSLNRCRSKGVSNEGAIMRAPSDQGCHEAGCAPNRASC